MENPQILMAFLGVLVQRATLSAQKYIAHQGRDIIEAEDITQALAYELVSPQGCGKALKLRLQEWIQGGDGTDPDAFCEQAAALYPLTTSTEALLDAALPETPRATKVLLEVKTCTCDFCQDVRSCISQPYEPEDDLDRLVYEAFLKTTQRSM